jgi:predicted nucleic acid-binding Zn ribbon protein
MNTEKIIAEIEWLEHIYTLPDDRPLQMLDRKAANHCPICGNLLVNDPLCTQCCSPFIMLDGQRRRNPQKTAHHYWQLGIVAVLIFLIAYFLIR